MVNYFDVHKVLRNYFPSAATKKVKSVYDAIKFAGKIIKHFQKITTPFLYPNFP
jgi:hypothetical protein